jgi:DNA repair exonuclease SbcCD ATPase subunit
MASVQQVQSVAKRLEKMLETSLNQLKIEQKMRKESENKLMDLELDLVNKEHLIRSLEDQIVNIKSEKDEKIINLESTINFLQSVVIQKEKEVLNMQEVLAKYNDGVNLNLDRTVENYEATLSQIIGGEDQDADDDDHNDVSDVPMDDRTSRRVIIMTLKSIFWTIPWKI